MEKIKINIVEGHDSGDYFLFKPVQIRRQTDIRDEDVVEYDEEFSIEMCYVDCVLRYFLLKYFDGEFVYNKNRHKYDGYDNVGFEWYLSYNFYSYDTCRAMIAEIKETAELLLTDYDAPFFDKIKEIMVDFYNRFADRLNAMMENNPSADAISIMGP